MLKLAFSTLSCPEWTFEEICDAAQQYGYDGIEFRGVGKELDLPNVPEFAPAQIAVTRGKLEAAGLSAVCLSSSISVVEMTAAEIDLHNAVSHAQRYIELAKEVGARYVRLFCGNIPPGMTRIAAMDRAAETLRRIGDFAQPRGVVAVVETHDQFCRTDQLMDLIRLANHPAIQVLWDIHHPYRLEGETIDHSMHNLDGRVRHIHVKDSVLNMDSDGYTYVPLGHGDIPIPDAMRALNKAGYDGYYALEWEKRWFPALEGPEMVLPQYVRQCGSGRS